MTMDSRMTHVRFITIILSSFALSLQFCCVQKKKLENWRKKNEFSWASAHLLMHGRTQRHKKIDRIGSADGFTEAFYDYTIQSAHTSIHATANFRWDTNYYLNLELSRSCRTYANYGTVKPIFQIDFHSHFHWKWVGIEVYSLLF